MLGDCTDQEELQGSRLRAGGAVQGHGKARLKTGFTTNNPGLCIVQLSVDQIVEVSQQVKYVRELIKKLAGSEASTILILGESGTGKSRNSL